MSPDLPIAYILPKFPQASQTFIAREIRGLREIGVPLLIFALGRLPATALDESDRRWYGELRFVPFPLAWSVIVANLQLFSRRPRTYLRTFASLVALPHRPRILVLRALVLMLVSAWVARQIERAGGCRQVHAHFALAQTEVAMVVSGLLGCPYSFTAHARDIYATPSALEEKIRRSSLVITCTAYNREHLQRLCPDVPAGRIHLVHHGVDADAVPRRNRAGTARDGRGTPIIVAAGRLIAKKGFDTLVQACELLRRRGVDFRCRIFGTGPLDKPLRSQVRAARLQDTVEMPGWLPNAALLEELSDAALFVMPSRISDTGDRDGIPNVVLEAMAAGLPVVATKVSGMPEAVADGVTGLLVSPDDSTALADALQRCLTDPALATSLGSAGAMRARAEFSIEASSRRLAAAFGLAFPD